MRLQAKHKVRGTSYTPGHVYIINCDVSRFTGRVTVTPHKRGNKHVKIGDEIKYANLSAFFDEWQILANLSHEEQTAFDTFTETIAKATGWLK